MHFLRNALDHLPRKADDCLMELCWLYDRRNVEEARRDLAAWLGKWAARYPKERLAWRKVRARIPETRAVPKCQGNDFQINRTGEVETNPDTSLARPEHRLAASAVLCAAITPRSGFGAKPDPILLNDVNSQQRLIETENPRHGVIDQRCGSQIGSQRSHRLDVESGRLRREKADAPHERHRGVASLGRYDEPGTE